MKILLLLRYDGGAFCGFQTQPNGVSVQATLTEAASRLLGFPCAITGCSRTDSGVHALGFCATLAPRAGEGGEAWCPIPVARLHRALNVLLPPSLAVMAAAAVPDSLHARYSVVSKTYEYRVWDAPPRDPFLEGRAYHAPRPLTDAETARMAALAARFVGRHDFSGYMSSGSKITDPHRTILCSEVERRPDGLLVYRVEADGFLYNMVRILTGTLLEHAWGRRSEADAMAALETGDRTRAGFTAPPEGLYLTAVRYDRPIAWECE